MITGSRQAKQIVTATVLAEVGDFCRFAHPRQLVACFGLASGEHSSGGTVRLRGRDTAQLRSELSAPAECWPP
ncbi:transposase [Bradyrhizobium sp. INPA03-11B]|uniref:transposase n=1 Tax=Bradyrhizobium sp. INPA03-11B TaxID=418598 RepID=UPI00338DBF83